MNAHAKPCAVCGYVTPSNARVALLVEGRALVEAALCPEHRILAEEALRPAPRPLPMQEMEPARV